MNKINQLIIIGGGTSIQEGIDKGLKNKIKNKFTLGCNYAYKFFPDLTATVYVDRQFYIEQKKELIKLPLVIGKLHSVPGGKLKNTIMLPDTVDYNRNLKQGVYCGSFCGLWTVSLGIFLLNEGEIFLLGFDFGAMGEDEKGRQNTHFYQGKFEHRGIGSVNFYNNKKRSKEIFLPFQDEKKCIIYNVSLQSKIPTFPKISYDTFFKMINKDSYNQKELREEIKTKLRI